MNKYVLLLDIQPGERAHTLVTTMAATQEKTHYQYRGPLSLSQHYKGSIIALSPEPEVEKLKQRLDVETVQVSKAV